MIVWEIRLKVFFIRDVHVSMIYREIANYIDGYLAQDAAFLEFHMKDKVKGYCFDRPFRAEKNDDVYKAGQIYSFRIRTVDEGLLSYFMDGIADYKTDSIKGIVRTVCQIPRKPIASVCSLTPVILAMGDSYWRNHISFSEFEKELASSLLNQYLAYTGSQFSCDFSLYDQIELESRCPIGVKYKGITLLGDKISMRVSDNDNAQDVLYFALANGMGTKGPRGCGFLGYRYV